MEIEGKRAYPSTYVYWDTVDFPLPEGYKKLSFYENVKSSLRNAGYGGEMTIVAYGDRKHSSDSADLEVLHSGIPLFLLNGKYSRLTNMLVETLACARLDPRPPTSQTSFMLILKDIPKEETELVRLVKDLKKSGHDVLLVFGDDEEEDEFAYPSEVLDGVPLWHWKTLVNGGSPVYLTTSDDEGSSPKRKRRSK